MITNFNSKTSRKDDAKLLAWIVFGFLIVAWLCTPPGNKFLQICFWGNNTQLFMSKLIHNSDNTECLNQLSVILLNADSLLASSLTIFDSVRA